MARRKATRLYKKDRAVYDQAHAAWRARAVKEFRYGARSPQDPTIVWVLDGIEYPKDARDEVAADIARTLTHWLISSIEIGPSWVGFAQMTVRYVDGSGFVEFYDGRQVRTRSFVAEQAA